MPLFNREAQVLIYKEGQQNAVKFSGLRIAFDIFYINTSDAQKAEITIYNLSENSRAKLNDDNLELYLYAGYKEDAGLELLFIGDITAVQNSNQGPDVLTKIQCASGFRKFRDINASVSFGPGATYADVFLNLTANYDFGIAGDYSKLNDMQFLNGFSYVGNVKFGIDKITQAAGYNWTLINKKITIIPYKMPKTMATIYELSPSSGLIGVPSKKDDVGINVVTGIGSPQTGWEITALLQPKISVGDLVKIVSDEVTGLFNVQSIEHQGDTRGQNWLSTLEAMEFSQ